MVTLNEKIKKRLKFCGKEVKIYPEAKIVMPEKVKVGDWSQIDDFTLIVGGLGVSIGMRVHIASFSRIIGGGKCILEDYSGLATGVCLITVDETKGGKMINPCIPEEFRNPVNLSFVVLKRHATLFTNVVVYPGVIIGEGCWVSAGSVVTKNCEPWSIYAGTPARLVKRREDKDDIMECERRLREKYDG